MINESIEQLSAWLDAPLYEQGVLLYEKLILPTPAGSTFVLGMLKAGADDYNRQILHTALSSLHEQLGERLLLQQASYPQPLVDALEDGKRLMDERTILKERLRMAYNGGTREGDELRTWSFRILDIGDELTMIYGRRHFFAEHGYLPDESEPVVRSAQALLTRRNTLRTFVSRYKKRLVAAGTEPERLKCQTLLAQYHSELFQIQQQLDTLTPTDDAISR
ncbi:MULTISPECIES: hypothetical protein [Spirosoma]|uniref:Uncharacterized protein n=1 Tax=Spirosoma sordidisoli TaxID=2502893 RepID=A0A4Q2UM19_9BACT|nr:MULTISPECIES: hypothetical protein [Spirosoma]RYC69792.1 hypothetical protein EQG79_14450 [Spirosoma sordidisoli]